ncbi:Panacea domain-containing protein [Terrabacter sp. C0L_2]|uniref:Panacea domain-containing protein n=1 Tax=Terrabacter sp. C0L_2 TaxID=3108389 RepID=UPI002ED1CBB8|nr:type II toxin-antitoxin system antitoxin SocA domain-containing protein [Terrabacter sp. C0L_2]
MATAVDVMRYITAKKDISGEVQLQKLMYYAQSWALAWDGRPLFAERIEAWQLGPVVPTIRHRDDAPDATTLTPSEAATVDAVLEYYGSQWGWQLGRLSHNEAPWKDVWGDRPTNSRCSDEITQDAMRRFYTSEAIAGRGPERPEMTEAQREATAEETSAAAAQGADEWRRALELLSE